MAKKKKEETSARGGSSSRAAVSAVGILEGVLRHVCGWVNVDGGAFPVGAGCPKCEKQITSDSVTILSDEEVIALGPGDAELEDDDEDDEGELEEENDDEDELEDDEDAGE